MYEDRQPYLQGGPLSSTFLLDSVHFHWGVVDSDGSEHAINGQKYALEAHFVFYNKAYQNSTYASNFPDGFSVLGILFKVDKNSPDLQIFKILKRVSKDESLNIESPVLNLTELIPKNLIYAYYKGSFTTPPCSQIVDWIVSLNEMTINPSQVSLDMKPGLNLSNTNKKPFFHVY